MCPISNLKNITPISWKLSSNDDEALNLLQRPSRLKIIVTALPLVARISSGNQRVYDLVYEPAGSDVGQAGKLIVAIKDEKSFEYELTAAEAGENKVEIRLPEFSTSVEQQWLLKTGDTSAETQLSVHPVRQWQLHISLHSHTDLGFTDTISNVAQIHADNTDQAMLLMEETADWPEESRFRWTMEITWQLEQYLKLRGPEAAPKLKKYLQSGQIELAALYAGEHVDALGHEEAVRAFYLAAKYRKEFGIPVDTAMLCDVPGSTEGLVQIMAKSGIKNFIIADNNFCAPILKRTDLPRPFNWRSRSGDEVTTWYTDHPYFAYIEGRHYGISESINAARKKLPYRLLEQEQAGYAHDLIHVQYAFDNFRLEFRPALVVREWNEKWEWPKLELSTPRRFFNAIRSSGDEIPTRSGDLTEWWTSTFNQYPVESAISKRLHDEIPNIEILSTLFNNSQGNKSFQNQRFEDIYHDVLGWDEHSGNGQIWEAEDPEDEMRALDEGYGLIYKARENLDLQTTNLTKMMAQSFRTDSKNAIVVANSLNWSRGGKAVISDTQPNTSYCLFDPDDSPLSHGHFSNISGELCIHSPEVPALGYRTFTLKTADVCGSTDHIEKKTTVTCEVDDTSHILSSRHLSLRINKFSGEICRLCRISDGKILHNSEFSSGLGSVQFWESHLPEPIVMGRFHRSYYEGVPGKPVQLNLPAECTIEVRMSENQADSPFIEIIHKYVDVAWLSRKISFNDSGERLCLDYNFHHIGFLKSGLLEAIEHTPNFPSMIYLAFPFEMNHPVFSYESTGMSLEAGDNQMKGSNHDFYAVHRWALLQDRENAVAIYPSDSMIVDPGQPALNTYRSEIGEDNSTLFFRVMPSASWVNRKWGLGYHNQDHSLHFEIESFAGDNLVHSQALAQTHGTEISTTLIAAKLDPSVKGSLTKNSDSFIQCQGKGLEVTTVKPAETNSDELIVRVREVLGMEVQGNISIPHGGYTHLAECQATEEVLKDYNQDASQLLQLNFKPFEIKTLKFTYDKKIGTLA